MKCKIYPVGTSSYGNYIDNRHVRDVVIFTPDNRVFYKRAARLDGNRPICGLELVSQVWLEAHTKFQGFGLIKQFLTGGYAAVGIEESERGIYE